MKTWVAVLITAFLTFIATSFLWFMGFIAWQGYQSAGLAGLAGIDFEDPFAVTYTCPDEVRIGESFDLVVHINNDKSTGQLLDSIDIYDSFLDGFHLDSVSFPHTHDNFGEFQSFWPDPEVNVPAGESTVVTFSFKATKPGTWSGDLDVCSEAMSFTTVVPRVKVLAAEPAATP